MKRFPLSALVFSTCLACGGSDNTPKTVTRACNFDADDYCDTFTGTAAALDAADLTDAACTDALGTVVSGCASVGRVGRCTAAISAAISVTEHYYPPTFIAGAAEALCVQFGGTWVAN
jgi:hypothetical protein